MTLRLTREQMAKQYPNQWLGLKNIQYRNNDGVTLESAEVVYTDKTRDELLAMQIVGTDGIIGWYTTENNLQLGFGLSTIIERNRQSESRYQTWEEIERLYPDEWIILGDAKYNEDGALLGGVIIERCTDENVDDAIIKYDNQGKDYLHLRTSTPFNNGVQIVC